MAVPLDKGTATAMAALLDLQPALHLTVHAPITGAELTTVAQRLDRRGDTFLEVCCCAEAELVSGK